MLQRGTPYLEPRTRPTADSAVHLHREGWVLLEQVFSADDVAALRDETAAVFANEPRDNRAGDGRSAAEDEHFRYAMFNRSAACQRAIGHPRILAAIEPLLGEDCHVIANTCWRNPAGSDSDHKGGLWHIDAGPHVPRPPEVPWPDAIPYPVFAVGAHLYLQDCPLEAGPTGVIPGSHRSGQHPPFDRLHDVDLTCDGQGVVPLLARAGDVGLFVSDVWHRRLPTQPGDPGRWFLQAHYGRRDIAQRLYPTAEANQVRPEAAARIGSERERRLLGLHPPLFYDG